MSHKQFVNYRPETGEIMQTGMSMAPCYMPGTVVAEFTNVDYLATTASDFRVDLSSIREGGQFPHVSLIAA